MMKQFLKAVLYKSITALAAAALLLLCGGTELWASKPLYYLGRAYLKAEITDAKGKSIEAMFDLADKSLNLKLEPDTGADFGLTVAYPDIRQITVFNELKAGHYTVEIRTEGGQTLQGFLPRNQFWLAFSEKELSSGWEGAEPQKQKIENTRYLSFTFKETEEKNHKDLVDYGANREALLKKIQELKKNAAEGKTDPSMDLRQLPKLMEGAKAAFEKADYPSALEALDRYISKSPEEAEAYRLRAACHEKLGRHRDRADALEQSYLIDPRASAILLDLARYYHEAVFPKRCIDLLAENFDCFENDDDQLSALWLLGLSCLDLKQPLNANIHASKALEIRDEAKFHFIRGVSLYGMKLPDHKRAIEAFESALKDAKNPKRADALYYLGVISLEQDVETIALDYFVKACRENPEHKHAKAEALRLMKKLGGKEKK